MIKYTINNCDNIQEEYIYQYLIAYIINKMKTVLLIILINKIIIYL